MIDWVPNKKINYKCVNTLLKKSEDCKQFTNYGPNVKDLEKYIHEKYKLDNNKSVIVVVNASLGLQILTKSISQFNNKNNIWATQSFTFPSSNQGSLQTSRILDIDLEGGLNLEEITDDIEGIIVTNVFGNIVNIDKYVDFCEKKNLFLVFDNAATHFTFYKNKNCLNYGTGCVISFHHTKPFGFGEGGAIIVDKKYENLIRKMINFGITNIDKEPYYSKYSNNCKMSDISAVYILQYLKDNFDNIIVKHRDLYKYFKTKITDLDLKLFPSFHDKNKSCVSCFCLLFKNKEMSIRVCRLLKKKGVFNRKYYHLLKKTPNANIIYDKILCLPCTIDMNYKDIDLIVDLLKKIIL
jgi:dTDP-4-amino-4,6-dideoxygalactose transaminase